MQAQKPIVFKIFETNHQAFLASPWRLQYDSELSSHSLVIKKAQKPDNYLNR